MNKGYEQPQTQGTNQNLMEMSLLLKELIEVVHTSKHDALWTASDVASFLQVSEASVVKNYFYIPGFPKGFRLPSKKGLGSRRWYATDIKNWCAKQGSL